MSGKIEINYFKNQYRRCRMIPPTFRNVLFCLRHPVFSMQTIWFAATVLGFLKIDHENLKQIFGSDRP